MKPIAITPGSSHEQSGYNLIRSARKTIAISVRRDGSVLVRAPLQTPLPDIRAFVESKSEWIEKHSARARLIHEKSRKTYRHGEYHPFMGRRLSLVIREGRRNAFSFSDDELIIETRNEWEPEAGEAVLNSIYRMKGREVFAERMASLIVKFPAQAFRPAALKVRTTVSRWGSCSASGTISLSSNLLKKRPELIDYVILHELCHLKHRNHGKGFYTLLSSLCPDHARLRKELREADIA